MMEETRLTLTTNQDVIDAAAKYLLDLYGMLFVEVTA